MNVPAGLAFALALLSALPAQAADRDEERARIAAERAVAQARFTERRRACNAVFAVTDCVNKVTRERNATLGDLRRRERAMNDAERHEKAAERLQQQEERNSAAARQAAEERRLRALQDQQDREARAAEKAQKRAGDEAERAAKPRRTVTLPGPVQPQGTPRTPQAGKDNGPTATEAARNRAAYEERVLEAERHKAQVRDRIARRSKPPASALSAPQ